jgi:hypothetical protein
MSEDQIQNPTPAPATDAQFQDEPPAEDVPAWEQVDPGRFMPRRIKGSYRGRALG